MADTINTRELPLGEHPQDQPWCPLCLETHAMSSFEPFDGCPYSSTQLLAPASAGERMGQMLAEVYPECMTGWAQEVLLAGPEHEDYIYAFDNTLRDYDWNDRSEMTDCYTAKRLISTDEGIVLVTTLCRQHVARFRH
ncbi:MAG: hypothetical protein ABI670_01160 [Chloroflexota bacterium]